jgi:5-methylcytosine-specific restriction endonuclease McrA
MKILPPRIKPPEAEVVQSHSPPEYTGKRGYRNYRDCLRWDFGFTCPFCLLHESDFMQEGTEGAGVMQIEHWVPRSEDAQLINEYSNCRYICRFCNQARQSQVVEGSDGTLLDPANASWSEHFSLSDDTLEVSDAEDVDAKRTLNVYDLNDDRKIKRRKVRRDRLEEHYKMLEEAADVRDQLQEEARKLATSDPKKASEKLNQAELLNTVLEQSRKEILRFRVIPEDRPDNCKCQQDINLQLPQFLEQQCTDLDQP